jgi:hypothetical protein
VHRFTIHHTPKHASWLNQAEIEISLFSRQCLGSRRIASLSELRSEGRAWNKSINRQRLKINWTFSRLDADNVFHGQLKLFKRSRSSSRTPTRQTAWPPAFRGSQRHRGLDVMPARNQQIRDRTPP